MNTTWSVLGVSWSDGVANWRRRIDDEPESSLVPIVGSPISYRVLARRVCLGHREFTDDGGRYVDCANDPRGAPRCERCTTIENIAAASMHQAHRLGRAYVDQRQTSHLEQPHRLYLAAFRDGSIKVGTTAGASGGVRLIEQGAWFAQYLVTCSDGYRVRDAEDAVTEQLGVPQAVSTSRKRRGMVQPMDDELLLDRLAALTTTARAVAIDSDPTATPHDSEPWRNPSTDDPRWSGVLAHPGRLDRGEHRLDVVDVVGRVGVLVSGPDHLAVDLSQLRGLTIAFGDVEPAPIEVQASLF